MSVKTSYLKKCLICGKEYEPDRWHKNQETCGDPICYKRRYKILHAERVRQANKRNREMKWFDGKRDEVLNRDSHTCVRCGSKNDIQVHHKDGKGRGYKGKIDNSLSNLETLCASCHHKHHLELIAKYNKADYQVGVAKHWDKSDREIASLLNISHPTVASIRKLVTAKILTWARHNSIDPRTERV